jgi:hypothetical protein
LDWIELDWIGLDWIGLDWIGLDWIGLDWVGLVSMAIGMQYLSWVSLGSEAVFLVVCDPAMNDL